MSPPDDSTRALRLRSPDDLPGPKGVPWLGNTFQIEPLQLHRTAEKWAERYGAPYRYRMGPRTVIAVSDPTEIARLLRARPDTFGRGTKLENVAIEMGIKGLFTSNGTAWQRQRPMVMAAFSPGQIKGYFPALVEVTERLMKRWMGFARSGQAIDLQRDLMRYTVDVTAGLAFGIEMNTIEQEGNVIQEHLNYIFSMLGKRLFSPVPYWRWFRLARDRKLERHLTALHEAVNSFIAQARARLRAEPGRRAAPENLIEAMLVARDDPALGLEDEDVAGNVVTMLLAGEDTTANSLAWLIFLLSRHPEVLARVKEEADTLLRERRIADRFEDLAHLPYLEACINESMRLKPVAPFLFLEARTETQIHDVAVPAGTMIMLLLRTAATDPTQFENATTFQPERWLEEGVRANSPKRATMPFGGGPRLCPGRYLALHEIKMVMTALLRNFDVKAVRAPETEPVERLTFTMEPVGLQMSLAPAS